MRRRKARAAMFFGEPLLPDKLPYESYSTRRGPVRCVLYRPYAGMWCTMMHPVKTEEGSGCWSGPDNVNPHVALRGAEQRVRGFWVALGELFEDQ